jgi:uncharacterized membrane protein YkgB
MSIDFGLFSWNLDLLGIKELLIYRIMSEQKYNSFNGDLFYVHKNVKTHDNHFVIQTLTLNELFNMEFFYNNIIHAEKIQNSNNILFVIEDIRYLDLVAGFSNKNINLTGGKNSLIHALSPLKFRLSQIITSIETGYKKGVNQSFFLEDKKEKFSRNLELNVNKPNIDWTTLFKKQN